MKLRHLFLVFCVIGLCQSSNAVPNHPVKPLVPCISFKPLPLYSWAPPDSVAIDDNPALALLLLWDAIEAGAASTAAYAATTEGAIILGGGTVLATGLTINYLGGGSFQPISWEELAQIPIGEPVGGPQRPKPDPRWGKTAEDILFILGLVGRDMLRDALTIERSRDTTPIRQQLASLYGNNSSFRSAVDDFGRQISANGHVRIPVKTKHGMSWQIIEQTYSWNSHAAFKQFSPATGVYSMIQWIGDNISGKWTTSEFTPSNEDVARLNPPHKTTTAPTRHDITPKTTQEQRQSREQFETFYENQFAATGRANFMILPANFRKIGDDGSDDFWSSSDEQDDIWGRMSLKQLASLYQLQLQSCKEEVDHEKIKACVRFLARLAEHMFTRIIMDNDESRNSLQVLVELLAQADTTKPLILHILSCYGDFGEFMEYIWAPDDWNFKFDGSDEGICRERIALEYDYSTKEVRITNVNIKSGSVGRWRKYLNHVWDGLGKNFKPIDPGDFDKIPKH